MGLVVLVEVEGYSTLTKVTEAVLTQSWGKCACVGQQWTQSSPYQHSQQLYWILYNFFILSFLQETEVNKILRTHDTMKRFLSGLKRQQDIFIGRYDQ